MANLEYTTYPLWPDFNKLYTDVINCKIVPPPYYQGFVPHSFFLDKRDWFWQIYSKEKFREIGYEEIFDIEEFGNKFLYIIGKKQGKILVIRYDTEANTYWVIRNEENWKEGINYKFLYVNTAKGKLDALNVPNIKSWTGSEVELVHGWGTTEKLSGTTTEMAGKYVYVYSKRDGATEPAGIWQIMKIDFVKDGKYNVASTGWVTKIDQGKARIYDSYGATLAFLSTDKIYVIHDFEEDRFGQIPNDILPIPSIENPLDAIYENNRLYVIQQPKENSWGSCNVFVGNVGFFAFYYAGKSLIGSAIDAYNITSFQNYILILTKKGIDIIQTVSTNVGNSTYTFEVLSNMTRDITVYWQNQFLIYNQWFYILSNTKRFYGVSITPQPNDKYTIELSQQGAYIQKFLDNIQKTDKIRFWVHDQDIYILQWTGQYTNIYIHNHQYKWWMRWQTNLFLMGYKYEKFFGSNIYTIGNHLDEDEGAINYEQVIRIIAGEDNIYQLKKLAFTKIVVWQNMSRFAVLTHHAHTGWYLEQTNASLRTAAYFDYNERRTPPKMSDLFYTSWPGRVVSWAPIAVLEVPAIIDINIDIIEIRGTSKQRLHYWGLCIWYHLHDAQVTEYFNTISY